MKNHRLFLLLALMLVCILGSFSVSSAQDRPFEGVTIKILSFTGPQVTEPLVRRGPD